MTHSKFLLVALVAACGGAAHSTSAPAMSRAPSIETTPSAPPAAYQGPAEPAAKKDPTGYADVNTDNSLISNGSVAASSEKLLSTASGFRREVYRLGGRVFSEKVHFRADAPDEEAKEASSATYRIKILPRMLPDLLDWLGKHADITSQDVSSIIAMESEGDAAIVRADVQARIAEIEEQLRNPALDPQFRAAFEQERAKLVGQSIADPNALADNTKRVAVLDVSLEAPRKLDPYAKAKMLGHARGSLLGLGIMGAGSSNRLGGGVGVGGRSPVASVEVMGYAPTTMTEKAGVTVTLGIGGYSKAFGGGNRGSLNPYLGARVGYAFVEKSYFAVAAEVGVELLKQRGILWTVSARPMGLLGKESQGAVELGSSLGLAF